MKRVTGVFVVFCTLCMLVQCIKEPVDLTGSISGTIVDSETNEAIKGVSVVITPGGDTKTTGTNGKYEYDELDPEDYMVEVSCDNYESDVKETSVVTGKVARLDFTLVKLKPELAVSVTELDFGDEGTQLSFEIENKGKSELDWELKKNAGWISVSKESGSATSDVASIVVNVDREGLEAKEYSDVLVVSTNAGTHEIVVTMNVPGALMGVSVESLDFGDEKTQLSFEISNSDKGVLEWEISKSVSWLVVTPTQGTTLNNSAVVLVSVNRDGLEAGDYADNIILSSNGGTKEILVAMEVAGANMQLSAQTLDFGKTEAVIPIEISNTDKGDLHWEITETASWLSVSPTKGTTTSDVSIVMVQVNRAGLAGGEYTDKLIFSSNAGSKEMPVSMRVEGADLSVSPLDLDFSTDNTTMQITLANTTEKGSVQYTIEKSHDWISLGKTSGTLDEEHFTEMINVVVNRADLSAGEYSGKITVKSDMRGDIECTVTMQVQQDEKPTITMGEVTDITYNTAKVGATMVSLGSHVVKSHGFCWDTTSEPTVNDNKTSLGNCTDIGEFEGVISDLTPETDYYIRAYATGDLGTAYSAERSFRTAEAPKKPEVATGDVDKSMLSAHEVRLEGEVTDYGFSPIKSYGFLYGTQQNLGVTNGVQEEMGNWGEKTGKFSADIIGLEGSTRYYYRAYAQNDLGMSYGEQKMFTTDDAAILVSSITLPKHIEIREGEQQKITAVVLPADAENKAVEWRVENANPTGAVTVADDGTVNPQAAGTAVVVASSTDGGGVEGRCEVTVIGAGLPKLSTRGVYAIERHTAIGGGVILDDGGSEIVERGVCWSTSPNPTLSDKVAISSSTSEGFTCKFTDLSVSTTYYVRAYATNVNGTSYGEEKSFESLEGVVPELNTLPITITSYNSALSGGEIIDDGGLSITQYGVCYGTTPQPSLENSDFTIGSLEVEDFKSDLTGLNEDLPYYARAYAINDKGVSYGNEVSFTVHTISYTINDVTFEMIRVMPGTFTMGATEEQRDNAETDEYPAHKVTLTNGFYIGMFEVTEGLWEAVMGENPSCYKHGKDFPVVCISWEECHKFTSELNRLLSTKGMHFALPTESQWEYAARGGNKSLGYKYSGGNISDDVAWCKIDNNNTQMRSVGVKQANELGLYDMSGNVSEFCQDWYSSYTSENKTNPICTDSSSGRPVLRGGSADIPAECSRVSSRSYSRTSTLSYYYAGLRLVLVLNE